MDTVILVQSTELLENEDFISTQVCSCNVRTEETPIINNIIFI